MIDHSIIDMESDLAFIIKDIIDPPWFCCHS